MTPAQHHALDVLVEERIKAASGRYLIWAGVTVVVLLTMCLADVGVSVLWSWVLGFILAQRAGIALGEAKKAEGIRIGAEWARQGAEAPAELREP